MLDVKFGICEWAMPGSPAGSVKMLADVGLDGMQIDFGSYERGFQLSQRWLQEYYLEECAKYNKEIPSMCICAFDDIPLKDPKGTANGDLVYSIIDQAVECAVNMKLERLMCPSFANSRINNDQEMEVTSLALKYACELAEPHGIMIITENTLNVEDNKRLLKLVGKENILCFYDSQNYWLNCRMKQVPILEGFLANGMMPEELHVKDGILDNLSANLLGEGDTDFYGTMAVLKKYNFKGWIHIENYYDRPPLNALMPEYIDILKKDLEILRTACG